jgi:hypothetical protein
MVSETNKSVRKKLINNTCNTEYVIQFLSACKCHLSLFCTSLQLSRWEFQGGYNGLNMQLGWGHKKMHAEFWCGNVGSSHL